MFILVNFHRKAEATRRAKFYDWKIMSCCSAPVCDLQGETYNPRICYLNELACEEGNSITRRLKIALRSCSVVVCHFGFIIRKFFIFHFSELCIEQIEFKAEVSYRLSFHRRGKHSDMLTRIEQVPVPVGEVSVEGDFNKHEGKD